MEAGQSIKSGIGTYLIYAGADYRTLKEQSDRIGKRLIKRQDKQDTSQWSYQELDLLSPSAIRTLKEDQVLVLHSNKHPFIINARQYFDSPKFSKMASK